MSLLDPATRYGVHRLNKHWVEHENDDQRDLYILFHIVDKVENRHRRVFSIVRNCLNDSKTWAAMGTIGKRVVITSIVGIE